MELLKSCCFIFNMFRSWYLCANKNWKKTNIIGTDGSRVNPYPANLIYLNFQPLEVVSRYRNPQLQVDENYSYLFKLSTNICKSWCSDTYFISKNSDKTDWLIKQIENDNSRDQQDKGYYLQLPPNVKAALVQTFRVHWGRPVLWCAS